MVTRKHVSALLALACLATSLDFLHIASAQEREVKVRNDQARILKDGFWTYNNLEKGMEQAKSTGKPLLVIFRCIPCEACAQLDEQVVENNPAVRKWLSQFVPVRIVHANGMDLSKFQFDYDQSWAAFFMNADGTIYGRYGTRSHQTESAEDVSLAGFLDTLQLALKLHAAYPQQREALTAKTGPASPIAHPEEYPTLSSKYGPALDYEGKVVQSCIHCHQVGEAIRDWQRSQPMPIPVETIFPYPHPKSLGMILDPETAVTVKRVTTGSAAESAGIRAGDRIKSLSGQPIISMADMQWVLHHCGNANELPIVVERGAGEASLTLKLESGWREKGDISWRASSWALRRMVTGGLRLDPLSSEERQKLGLEKTGVGLRVRHVGQFDAHAAAKRAGFQKDDVLVKVGDSDQPLSESQLFAKLLRSQKPGDTVPVTVDRNGKRLTLDLPIQK